MSHKCKGKCPEFKGEQCNHCLIGDSNYSGNSNSSDFLVGDYVVMSDCEKTKPELLAVEVVEEYEAKYGKGAELDYYALRQIYSGNLLDAINMKRIKNHQKYGVTFFSKIESPDGTESTVERGITLDMKMSINQFISGVHSVTGQHIWQGAGDYWLEMMDKEFPDCICHDAWAVANCLVKGAV